MYYPDQANPDDIMEKNIDYLVNDATVQHWEANGLLGMLKREATALHGYYMLQERVRHEGERAEIFNKILEKQDRIQQLTKMYISLTGLQPVYHHDHIVFQSYQDGLNQLREFELTTLEYYRYYYSC